MQKSSVMPSGKNKPNYSYTLCKQLCYQLTAWLNLGHRVKYTIYWVQYHAVRLKSSQLDLLNLQVQSKGVSFVI